MSDLTSCGIYSEYDFYDHDKVEKLQEKRSKQKLKLYLRYQKGKEKQDEEAMKKAAKAIINHDAKDDEFRRKAEDAGYYWY